MTNASVFLVPHIISWISKKQLMVSRSNVEAEYHTIAHVITVDLCWVCALLWELGIYIANIPTIYKDSWSHYSWSPIPLFKWDWLPLCTRVSRSWWSMNSLCQFWQATHRYFHQGVASHFVQELLALSTTCQRQGGVLDDMYKLLDK